MLRTGSICTSFLYKYITSSVDDGDNFQQQKKRMKILGDVFADCGGVLSKVSQIINIDTNNYSNDVFSECKPYNEEKTIEFVCNGIKSITEITDFDKCIFKSGSIGQVHKAKLLDGSDIVVKVQYYNLLQQFEIDIEIIKNIMKYIFSQYNSWEKAIVQSEKTLYEELDYKNEIKNHIKFFNLWENDNNIKISKVYDDLSTDKIIIMEYINGKSLSSFLIESTQDDKNIVAFNLFKFIFQSMFKYGLFYCDIHVGNFLIKDDNTLYVLDFGHINKIDEKTLNNLKLLYLSLYNDDKDLFYVVVKDLGILTDKIDTDEELEYMYEQFKIYIEPLLCKTEYTFKKNWISELNMFTNLTSKWEIPSNISYLLKIPNGLFFILCNLEASFNMSDFILEVTKI